MVYDALIPATETFSQPPEPQTPYTMTEGLKVTIKGAELRELCLKRVEHHSQRALVYVDQVASMEANEIEGMNYSGGDPKRQLLERREHHEAEASELQFIGDHLNITEDYLLDRDDLRKLGICKGRH
jgi:hypothetical protein